MLNLEENMRIENARNRVSTSSGLGLGRNNPIVLPTKNNSVYRFTGMSQIKQCLKIDFNPFTTNYNSNSNFGNEMFYAEAAIKGSADVITSIFIPEDVEINGKLFCLWIAE